jgi:hypothetical protein
MAPQNQQRLEEIGLERFMGRCKRCIDNEGDFVKNNSKFVQDVNIINVNSIIIVITVL